MTSSYPSAPIAISRTPIAISRTPGEQTFPSITVPPCDGTNTSAAQQMQHAQQELSLQQKIRELAKHYQSRR